MELLDHLALGFSVALSFENLFYCFMGVLLGTAIGVLPGLGPLPTTAMLLPLTFTLEPTSALIMLSGIYYGAQYGGSTTAILVNLPGESSSVVTCLDGYQMARQGRAGPALAIAALGSFFAGTVATLFIAAAAPALAKIAFIFGPAEYFSLITLGLICAVMLAGGSILKALAMVVTGLALGLVGTDVNSGTTRYTFGIVELWDGLEFVAVAMGVFAFAEIMANVTQKQDRQILAEKITNLWPSRKDFREAAPAVVRGTMLGSILGVLPGGGAVLSSFTSYAVEKRISKTPEMFGKGAVAGLAGPESANNAGAQASFIPMLTLGIPANALLALLIGAMMIHNIQPGPQVMTRNPELFWGLIASMWLGNLMLVVLNLPLVGLWVKLLKVPYHVLFPAIVVFCCIGVYSIDNASFDILVAAAFGVAGFVFAKLKCEAAPLLLGFILGPMVEENFRRAMLLSHGGIGTFVERPLSLALLSLALLLTVVVSLPFIRRRRKDVFISED
jgi:putative tricarboxylic transport membrane protein